MQQNKKAIVTPASIAKIILLQQVYCMVISLGHTACAADIKSDKAGPGQAAGKSQTVPGEVKIAINQAKRQLHDQQYGRVLDTLNQAARSAPDYWEIYMLRGDAYIGLVRYKNALAEYDKLIRLRPDLAQAYAKRGNAHDHLDDFELSIKDYREASRLDPKNPYYLFNLADNLGELGRVDEALQVLDKGVAIDPKCITLRRLRGMLRGAKGHDLKGVIEDYTIYINAKGYKYEEVYFQRGDIYRKMHDYPHAIADFTELIKINKDDVHALQQRASSYEALNQFQKAIDDYSVVIKQGDEAVESIYAARARCYRKLGKANLAKRDEDMVAKLKSEKGW